MEVKPLLEEKEEKIVFASDNKLTVNEKGKQLLSGITHANPKLEIVTSVKKFLDTSNNKILKSMLEKDIFATDIYTLGYTYDSFSNLDYTHGIINL